MIRLAFQLWRCKWGFLRLLVACFCVYALASDAPARFARMQLAALPDFDYLAETRALRAQGRYGEAVMVAQTGLESQPANAELKSELDSTIAERDGWLLKAKRFGMGALSGRGDSLESLIGAVAADFFVVGDLRDLVVEGSKQMIDGDSDELVLTLSLVGIVTTVAPEIDWAPSILKAAKRAGHMTEAMMDSLKKIIRSGDKPQLAHVCEDVAGIAKKASPGAAMRVLKLTDSPEDLARVARFIESNSAGAFALHVTGKEGALVLKGAGKSGEDLIIAAAKKGRAGTHFLTGPAARVLTRPHPLLGLAKAVWKGNAEKMLARIAERVDPRAWFLLPAAAAWAMLELGLLVRRLRPQRAAALRSRM